MNFFLKQKTFFQIITKEFVYLFVISIFIAMEIKY